jgi:hypothetical protein
MNAVRATFYNCPNMQEQLQATMTQPLVHMAWFAEENQSTPDFYQIKSEGTMQKRTVIKEGDKAIMLYLSCG